MMDPSEVFVALLECYPELRQPVDLMTQEELIDSVLEINESLSKGTPVSAPDSLQELLAMVVPGVEWRALVDSLQVELMDGDPSTEQEAETFAQGLLWMTLVVSEYGRKFFQSSDDMLKFSFSDSTSFRRAGLRIC